MIAQLLLWLWLGIFGFLVTRRVFKSEDPWLVLGSTLPVALICLLGLFFPLAQLLGHPQGWIVGGLILFVATVTLYVKRGWNPPKPLEEFGFSPFQWASFLTLLTGANLVMHTFETVGPEDDYWIHFPLISLLNRGQFPPPNPFFEDLSLFGHFGRDYIVAVLAWFQGGGEAILNSLWSFNHLLSISCFFLAFGLGRRSGGTAGGFLMSVFLFFGISVGSRVGMMDTYDNNNLLVYCLLLLFVALETIVTKSRVPDLFLAFALGVYGIVYETHLILFCMMLWFGPLLWRRLDSGIHPRQWLRPLGITMAALVVSAFMGGPIQDLAMRATGMREVKVDHASTYQAQRVQLKFPKEHLFQILLGPESYRRLSYVYQGKRFSGLHKVGSSAGQQARQDFRYASIFSADVLLMHWLALYLGLPLGFWLLFRRAPVAQALWVFGLMSFLVPAVVDFGPVHEREYFRWEFAAGFGFAGALAGALAILWSRDNRVLKALVLVLAMAVNLGGQRKLNRIFIDIEKMPEEKRKRALSPFYPTPREWILGSPELRVDRDLLDAALELRERSKANDRMLVDLDPRSHWEIFQEATVAGLAGLRTVGHVSPPPWMPDGIAPFFRNASWNAFWQTGDTRILPFLGSRWLLTHRAKSAALLEGQENLKRFAEFGEVSIWRYDGELGSKTAPPSEQVKIVNVVRPGNRALQSEVALPLTFSLENAPTTDFDLGIEWIPLPGTDTGGPIEALKLRYEPGQTVYHHYLVAPLVEGRYRLRFTINDQEILRDDEDEVLEFDWTREAAQATVLRLAEGRVEFEPGSKFLVPPLRVGLRLFRLDEQAYGKPFGFEAVGIWKGEKEIVLSPQDEDFFFVLAEGLRGDLFLLDRSGREVPLKIEGREEQKREVPGSGISFEALRH